MKKIKIPAVHYSAYMIHQILKIPGTKYIRDFATVQGGRVYIIEFQGVQHMLYGIGMPEVVDDGQPDPVQFDDEIKSADYDHPLMFNQVMKFFGEN